MPEPFHKSLQGHGQKQAVEHQHQEGDDQRGCVCCNERDLGKQQTEQHCQQDDQGVEFIEKTHSMFVILHIITQAVGAHRRTIR
ncbi:hypothetical protein [Pontibacter rugosus]|uniref:Uncharacterized protein n=1 Tax=Pontibacter rugosus TaxID=1745966 RepID=A0ABW3STV1_9BACT